MSSYTAEDEQHRPAVEPPRGFTSAPQPSNHVLEDQTQLPVNIEGLVTEPGMMNEPGQEIAPDFPTDNGLGMLDQGWGLFDTQPTLGWLDAGFSFYNSNQ